MENLLGMTDNIFRDTITNIFHQAPTTNLFPATISAAIPLWRLTVVSRPITEICRWSFNKYDLATSFLHAIISSVRSFFSRLPTHVLLALKQAGFSVLLAPQRLIGWLWKLSGFGPKLTKAVSVVLTFLRRVVTWTTVLGGIGIAVLIGKKLYEGYYTGRESYDTRQQSQYRSYYTNSGNSRTTGNTSYPDSARARFNHSNFRPNSQHSNARHQPRAHHTGQPGRHGFDPGDDPTGHRRDEARWRRAAEQEAAEREAQARRREAEAQRRETAERKAAAKRQELSNAFKSWMEEVKVVTADKAKARSIPQPLSIPCADVSCKTGRKELDVTFCKHSLAELVDAYAEVNKLSAEAKRELLDQQRKVLHPDRFTRCPEEVRERVQQVAEELMKVIHQVM